VIDLHTHVLPGIDDGPPDLAGSLAFVRAAHRAGTRTLVATPHVSTSYRNTSAGIAERVEELNDAIEHEGLDVRVVAGAEIAASRVADLDPAELRALSLGGGPWLLIECPLSPRATGFDAVVLYLRDAGHRILLAHPERCPAFQKDPDMLRSLVGTGMLTSVTAGSLVGDFGREAARSARMLAEEGILHNVVSDAHDAVKRPPELRPQLLQAGLAELSEWLVEEVPAAILGGDEVPPAPVATIAVKAPQQRSRSWWRRRVTQR
jgi:protein-tyrosine phosphatase